MSQEACCLFSADQIMSIVVNSEGTEKNIYFSRACKNIGKMTPVLMSHVVRAAQHTVVQQIWLCLSMLQTGLQHYLSRQDHHSMPTCCMLTVGRCKLRGLVLFIILQQKSYVRLLPEGIVFSLQYLLLPLCFPHPLKHLSKRQADDISF